MLLHWNIHSSKLYPLTQVCFVKQLKIFLILHFFYYLPLECDYCSSLDHENLNFVLQGFKIVTNFIGTCLVEKEMKNLKNL